MIRVGIIGITGYTGEELLRILSHHKDVKITVLAGRAESEIKNLKDIYPKYADLNLKCYPLNIEQMKKEISIFDTSFIHHLFHYIELILLLALNFLLLDR